MLSTHVSLELVEGLVSITLATALNFTSKFQKIQILVFNFLISKKYLVLAIWYTVSQIDVFEKLIIINKSNL